MRARLLLGCALVLALGCAGKKVVPVSGTVKMNGKPLAGATVNFQPIATQGSPDAGVGSTGKTDAEGHYTLETSTGLKGAVVGKHRVMISVLSQKVGDSDERPPRGGWPIENKVPDRYNNNTTLEKDVPAEGSDKMDFDLTSP